MQKISPTGAAAGSAATSLTPNFSGGGGAAVAATAPVGRIAALAALSAQPHQPPQAPAPMPLPLDGASAFREPGLQQQVAAGQQAQAWAERMGAQLQTLKSALAGLLGGSGGMPGEASSALQQLKAGWQQRSTQAGGLVDGQLRVLDAPGQARQLFTLRGLDAAALAQDGAETLSFALPGAAAAIKVAIDPDQGAQAAAQGLDQAMAPAGLRVAVAAGQLVWSAAEDQWPALRDGVSVKGEGRRFPSGQRVRVRLDALPEAVQPATWSLDGTAAQRQTLARVIAAQGQLREVAAQLGRRQAAAQLPAPADASAQGPLLLGVAEAFKARAEGEPPSYEHVAALRGLGRERVRALLSR